MLPAKIFPAVTSLIVPAVAALLLLTPALTLPARAQAAQQAALSDNAKSDGVRSEASKSDVSKSETSKSDPANSPVSQTTNVGGVAPVDQAGPAQQKSLAAKALEKVKQVAKSASDIFGRVPCLPPKGGAKSMGSLPHVAAKLAPGSP